MKEIKNNIIHISELREKLGFSPKKCVYKIVDDEVIIFSISEEIKDFSA